MNPPSSASWSDANQRVLVAEFARLRLRLGAEGDVRAVATELEDARAAMMAPAAIDHLVDSFGLSAFERDVLLLCAGVEMDSGLAAQCAHAVGDSRRTTPTFALALGALESPHWSALAPAWPLRRWRMVEVDDAVGLTQGRLRIDERILHYLAGVNYMDVRIRPLVRPAVRAGAMAESHRTICDTLHATIAEAPMSEVPVIELIGDDRDGQADVASEVAGAIGLDLRIMRSADVPTPRAELDALITLWERDAILLGTALLVQFDEIEPPLAAVEFAGQLRCLVFASSERRLAFHRPAVRFDINKPNPVEQKSLWQRALGDGASTLNGALDGIASQFKLSARDIRTHGARLAPAMREGDGAEHLVWTACRTNGRSRLDEVAQRIESTASWNDLILPDTQQRTLRQITAHVRNRLRVHEDWGFGDSSGRGLGITALFAGESGTGKTTAAEVLGAELNLDLYRIDLSCVVSKYIGETEKNLRRVFDAAEESGAILLFDEADALFGKRSDVKDSHDRYANIEVSYLLQRMESYRGLAILTSNMKDSLDSAFQRRLRFVVQFPFPDQQMREAIWRRVFPPRAPMGDVAYEKLARLNVTGGTIRNIALNAAFLAAEAGERISMNDVLSAARRDASKRDRPLSDAEVRGWV